MAAELIVTILGKGEQRFPLADFNIIGRSKDAAIQLDDNGVSREHSSIRRDDKGYWINDLASANGTYLNNMAVARSEQLRNGDEIIFGTVNAVFAEVEGSGASFKNSETFQTRVLKRTEVSVSTAPLILLVGDIRGFTEISSRVPPERLAGLVRGWYDDCREVLNPLGATIDKFIGDAVFAYWRDTGPAARLAAVKAARALREGAGFSKSGLRTMAEYSINFECRVGLHIGEVAHGAMTRGNNTALGDAVNLTFRIESLTRELNADVLASAAFLRGWAEGAAQFSPCGFQNVKGHPEPIEIFSLG